MSSLVVGDEAPAFVLPGTGGASYDLRSQRGSPVVLAFYPEDFSPVCSAQLRAYSSSIDDFRALGTVMWGISPQGVESHADFAERRSIRFPLLADVDREVARAYGVLGPLGFYRRSVFVLDRDLRIRYLHIARAGLTFRPSEELLAAVEEAVGA